MSKIIAIFAGHGVSSDGTWDSGCAYGKYTEAALVEQITKSAVYYLKQCKLNVITDVPRNRINMNAQIGRANEAKADLFVSVHCDYWKASSGTIPLYKSEAGRKAATIMNRYVKKYSSLRTRGLSRRTDLKELNATNMPAVIFECGAIKADIDILTHEYDAIGFGLARGICEYLNVEFEPAQYILLQKLAGLEKSILKQKFRYDGTSTNINFANAAKGDKKINCALFISWGLQRTKVLNFKQRIWLGNKVHGNGASALKAKCKVMHPDKYPHNCDLHIGDVVGFQWGSSSKNLVHTMVFMGFDKRKPIWFTCGSSDIKAKDLSRKRTAYESKRIKTICRLT